MNPDRWSQVERLFHDALKHPVEQRAAFVSQACAGDFDLKREVQALLEAPATAFGFLDDDALAEAARLVSQRSSTAVLAGRRMGAYELKERIGVGGMGEVYRARDTRLERDVAIKILPRGFTSDSDRQSRFEREARVLAALNHPNIGAVYGFEESTDDTGHTLRGIVLELVEGETLAERLERGPVPIDEVLTIAKQIVDALEAAHEKGIVHRDLKPSNIKLGPGGMVKVLDFGLAKTTASGSVQVPAQLINLEGTTEGVILGTAAYMSPEQARGRSVDRQTDIWALGCVLYEMLTARSPFAGETTSDTLAAILGREPDWRFLPAATPPSIVRLLERCLTKDAMRRLRDVGDVRIELDEAVARVTAAPVSSRDEAAGGVTQSARWQSKRIWRSAAGLVALIAGVVVAWRVWPADSASDPLANAAFTRLTDWEGGEQQAAISRDGRFVAFISDRGGTWDAWVGQVGAGNFSNLTNGRVQELRNPAVRNVGFTPDGSLVTLWVRLTDPKSGVQTAGWVVPTIGGQLRPYMDRYATNVADVDWSSDSKQLVFHTSDAGDPMFVAGVEESTLRRILAAEPGVHNHFPLWSPDGGYIYFVRGYPPDEMDIWRIRPSGGSPERLTSHESRVAFPTFLDHRTLLYLATADDGSGPWIHVMDVDRRSSQRISTSVDEYSSISASEDGRRLVGSVSRSISGLWRAPVQDTPAADTQITRLVLPTTQGLSPRIGPDYLIYRASTAGTDGLWKLSDGESPVELWSGRNGRVVAAPAIAPDGTRIAFPVRRRGMTRLHVMNAGGSNVRILNEELDVRGAPAWSPDGQWIATAANRDGQPALFKLPVSGGAPVPLGKEYALDPTWSPSGRFLIYSGADVGMTFPLKAVTPEGDPHPLRELTLSRGARRVRFMVSDNEIVVLKGDITYKELWLVDVTTGRERQLTSLGRSFVLSDFDISSDGRAIVFDRSREESDIVLIERPAR